MDALSQIEGVFLLWIQEHLRQEWMTPFWKLITSLGDSGWFWIVLALALVCFRRWRRTGVTVLLAVAIGALITNVALKPLVARIRPYDVIEGLSLLVERQIDLSFPSGHTCAAFAAGTVCFVQLRRPWGACLLALAVLIAVSRLYVGVHYPTDVLGGMAVGLFGAWAALRLVAWKLD